MRKAHPNVFYADLVYEARELLKLETDSGPDGTLPCRKHLVYVDGRPLSVLIFLEADIDKIDRASIEVEATE